MELTSLNHTQHFYLSGNNAQSEVFCGMVFSKGSPVASSENDTLMLVGRT